MTSPVRFGLLSTARINRKLLIGAAETDAVEIVAVASRDRTRAEAYSAANGISKAHGSYGDLLNDAEIDAVYISLPNALHVEWTMRALDAGKHVLVEKPFSRQPLEVEAAYDLADRSGLILAEAFMWRHNPQTERLLQLLPEIGELVTIRSTFSHRLNDGNDVRLSEELEGGSLMDVGCYCVNGARALAGREPEWVFATKIVGETGVDVRFSGVMSFSAGLVAEFACGFVTRHETLEAVGTHGTLFLPDPWHVHQPAIFHDGRELRLERENSYRRQLEDFARAVRGGTQLLGRADALGQARTIEALYLSAERHEPVVLTH